MYVYSGCFCCCIVYGKVTVNICYSHTITIAITTNPNPSTMDKPKSKQNPPRCLQIPNLLFQQLPPPLHLIKHRLVARNPIELLRRQPSNKRRREQLHRRFRSV